MSDVRIKVTPKLLTVKLVALRGLPAQPTQEQINTAVTEYMDDHPEHTIPDGSITEQKLSDDAVTTDKIADESVTTDKLANNVTAPYADNLVSSSYVSDSEPYLFRKTFAGVREDDEIVGGSLVWNQLVKDEWIRSSATTYGLTITNNGDGTVTINGTVTDKSSTATPIMAYIKNELGTSFFHCIKDHKYLYLAPKLPEGVSGYNVLSGSTAAMGYKQSNGSAIFNCLQTADTYAYGRLESIQNGATFNNYKYYFRIFDLTLMFGSTIADYLYTQEQATAGAGVALAKAWAGITANYYPYDEGTIKSVTGLTAHKMTGFNQWDEEWEKGDINTATGQNGSDIRRIRSKNYCPTIPNAIYSGYMAESATKYINIFWYDADKSLIKYIGITLNGNQTVTAPDGASYFRILMQQAYGTTYLDDICINLSDPSKNGTYEPYTAHTYPLDSSLTLRGIPKLDANNNLYYDGDIYPPSGEVTRRYLEVTLTKDMTYVWTDNIKQASISDIIASAPASYTASSVRLISDKLKPVSNDQRVNNVGNYVALVSSGSGIALSTPAQTLAEFMTWIASNPVTVVYELATPTTETAEPYTALQTIYDGGTEEYVTDSIPVGHNTKYMRDLKKLLEGIPDAPSADGTYTLRVTVSGGVATYSWE